MRIMARQKRAAAMPQTMFEDSDLDKKRFMSVSMRIEKEWRVVTYRSVGLLCTVFMNVYIHSSGKRAPYETYELDGVSYKRKIDLLTAINSKVYGG